MPHVGSSKRFFDVTIGVATREARSPDKLRYFIGIHGPIRSAEFDRIDVAARELFREARLSIRLNRYKTSIRIQIPILITDKDVVRFRTCPPVVRSAHAALRNILY